MHYRTFGRTGLRVSTVSLGCNRLGDPGVDPAVWPPIVERALQAGVSLLDTSISYNQGRSEAIIGQVTSRFERSGISGQIQLRSHSASGLTPPRGSGPTGAAQPCSSTTRGQIQRCSISSKVGFSIDFDLGGSYAQRDYSAAAILRGIDGQLARLRRSALDVCLLHSPSVGDLEGTDWACAIDTLRQQGKARWFGISTSDHASGLWAIQHGADALQVEFDLLNPTAADELLPAALERNVGIMVRTPLARGLLTGKFAPGQPIPPEQQWRRPKGEQLQLRLRRIEQLRFLERPGQTLGQAAMRWVLSHPAVHCVVPGARTLAQLEENLAAADGELTPDELERVTALHAAWRAEGRW